jgi:hypothetical protein
VFLENPVMQLFFGFKFRLCFPGNDDNIIDALCPPRLLLGDNKAVLQQVNLAEFGYNLWNQLGAVGNEQQEVPVGGRGEKLN